MSDDGVVTRSDVVRDATPYEVTPGMDKGALGLDGHLKKSTGLSREEFHAGAYLLGKPFTQGVYVSWHLSFGVIGKVL